MGKPYTPKDHFFKKAKQSGFRARSAFKIEEITDKLSLPKKGHVVLDLGAAPGGFLQVLVDRVGPTGKVFGVDLVPIRAFSQSNVKTVALDVLAEDFDEKLKALFEGDFDLIASDLAPKTTGIKDTDEARSHRLVYKALDIAKKRGRRGCAFVAKVFMGREFETLRKDIRSVFSEFKIVRPEATRGASMEVYVIGLNKNA